VPERVTASEPGPVHEATTDLAHDPAQEQLPRTADVAPPPEQPLRALRPVGAQILRAWYDVRVHGAGHVPAAGPVLLACNHIGLFDGPLLTALAPRVVHALVKREMFDGLGGPVFRGLGQIAVHRVGVDPFPLKQSVRVLRDGGVVAVYPEGTRGRGDVAHSRVGAAYLAMVTGAPVVPVAHLGTRRDRESVHAVPGRGSRVDVVFGMPLRPASAPVPWPRRQDEVADLAEELRVGLAAHAQHALRLTGQRLPGEPPDGYEDEPGRRGREVGPESKGRAS
jgi:1-acyl-sn-glycerol-3-phosphate acyltransferase